MPCCPSAFPWTGVGMPCNRTLLLCYPCPSHHGTCMQTPSFSAVGLSHRNPTDGSNNTDYFNKTLVQQGLGSVWAVDGPAVAARGFSIKLLPTQLESTT